MSLGNISLKYISGAKIEMLPDGRLRVLRRWIINTGLEMSADGEYGLQGLRDHLFDSYGTADGAAYDGNLPPEEKSYPNCVLVEQQVRPPLLRQGEPKEANAYMILEKAYEQATATLTQVGKTEPQTMPDGQVVLRAVFVQLTSATYTAATMGGVVGTSTLAIPTVAGSPSAVLKQEREEVGLAIRKVVREYVASGIIQAEWKTQADGLLQVKFVSANTRVVPTALSPIGTWNSGTAYLAGNFAIYSGVLYQAVINNTNEQPPNATYWAVVPSYAFFGTLTPVNAVGAAGLTAWPNLFQGGTATPLVVDDVREVYGARVYEVVAVLTAAGGAITLSSGSSTTIRSYADTIEFEFPGQILPDTTLANLWVIGVAPTNREYAVTITESINPGGVTPAPGWNAYNNWSGPFYWAVGWYQYVPVATGLAVNIQKAFGRYLGGGTKSTTNSTVAGIPCSSSNASTASNPTYAAFVTAFVSTFVIKSRQRPAFVAANGVQYYRVRTIALT